MCYDFGGNGEFNIYSETDEDFLETMKVVNECKYDSAFTFIYSKRTGTPAAKMPDSIDLKVRKVYVQRKNKETMQKQLDFYSLHSYLFQNIISFF